MRRKFTLPSIPPGLHSSLDMILSKMKEVIEIREGTRGDDYLNANVTIRDLLELGVITNEQAKYLGRLR